MSFLDRSPRFRALLPWAIAVVVLALYAAIALATRPLTPVDETRYATVAWEMWLRGDFLVPYLDGAPYSHKPPLLFWLIGAGWWLFGVGEIWPRLLPACFGLASLALMRRLAAALWPQRPEVARFVPALLFSTLLFPAMATFLGFDLLLTVWVLCGALGLARVWRGRATHGWLLFGLAVGAGLLAKGPVVLLHLLPLALLAPWWSRTPDGAPPLGGWRWYAPLAAATAGGVLLALAWAVPAAIAAGPAFRDAIFLGQTAGRLVHSFQHARPFWWYLPLLPVMLFPLLGWPPLWRGLRSALARPLAGPVRFCLAWAAPPFLAFSLISGKQPQYLLPLLPSLVLLAACSVTCDAGAAEMRRRLLVPGLVLGLFGLGLLAIAARGEVAGVELERPGLVAIAGLLTGLVALCAASCRTTLENGRRSLALVAFTVYAAAHAVFAAGLAAAYDVAPMARFVASVQERGAPVAFVGEYHGRYQFAGRLTRPVEEVRSADAETWAAEHPAGVVIDVWEEPRFGPAPPLLESHFKGRHARAWRAEGLRALVEIPGATGPSSPGRGLGAGATAAQPR